MLLLRGFDSVAQSLSQLSNNIENALQGARDLARPPTLTDIVHATLEKAKTEENNLQKKEIKDEQHEEDNEEESRGLKRKIDSQECCENQRDHSKKAKEKSPQELGKIQKAKSLAISMATKATSLATEMKSIRSDLSFVQERCALLEEENRKLRVANGIRPDDEDLVRLQLETLLAEKSRLANQNANLTRENQCLHQLVDYHQQTSEDLSESYENLTRGICLDFSSPLESGDRLGFCKSLDDKCYEEE